MFLEAGRNLIMEMWEIERKWSRDSEVRVLDPRFL